MFTHLLTHMLQRSPVLGRTRKETAWLQSENMSTPNNDNSLIEFEEGNLSGNSTGTTTNQAPEQPQADTAMEIGGGGVDTSTSSSDNRWSTRPECRPVWETNCPPVM